MTAIETNAPQLAAAIGHAADQLAAGLDDASRIRMGQAMLAAARPVRRTGHYAGTVRTTASVGVVSLVAGGGVVDYAHIVEFGSRYMPGRRVLGKAVETSMPEWVGIAAAGVQRILNAI